MAEVEVGCNSENGEPKKQIQKKKHLINKNKNINTKQFSVEFCGFTSNHNPKSIY